MQRINVYVIALSLSILIACQGHSQTPTVAGNLTNTNPDLQVKRPSPTPVDTSSLCEQVRQIKVLPFKGDQGRDKTYDSLVAAGDAVVPCLIDKVTDATPMQDPRETLKFAETKVGDVAYFVLIDITHIDFAAPFPTKIKEDYKSEGVYAYFRFVEKPSNRKKLQQALRDWFKNTHTVSSE